MKSASSQIDAQLRALGRSGSGAWRGEMLAKLRALIKQADPDVVEAVKWRNAPVWEHAGVLCVGGAFKNHVKLTFAKGAALPDPKGVFNAGLEGNAWRAIDLHEGDAIDEAAFKALVQAAVALNTSVTARKASPKETARKKVRPKKDAKKSAPPSKAKSAPPSKAKSARPRTK